jgi:hypothetical protein
MRNQVIDFAGSTNVTVSQKSPISAAPLQFAVFACIAGEAIKETSVAF